jgi:phage terminase small subunit
MATEKIKLTDEQKELAKALSPLQRGFVINLVSGMTQRKAIKEAGSTAKTDNSLDNVATQIFSRLEVKAFYDSLMETKIIDSIMGRDEALSILSKNARVSMTDVADFALTEVGKDSDGNPIMQTVWTMKDSKDIDPKVISCIKSVTMTKQGPKIELHDQQGAIKQLSAMQGWDSPKKTELSGKDGKPLAINTNISAPEIASALSELMNKL